VGLGRLEGFNLVGVIVIPNGVRGIGAERFIGQYSRSGLKVIDQVETIDFPFKPRRNALTVWIRWDLLPVASKRFLKPFKRAALAGSSSQSACTFQQSVLPLVELDLKEQLSTHSSERIVRLGCKLLEKGVVLIGSYYRDYAHGIERRCFLLRSDECGNAKGLEAGMVE
jgi:hypothetical protein